MNTNNQYEAQNFDFNTADKQGSIELIPANTIVPVLMTLRPGGKDAGGWLKESKTSENMMLDCEFTVTEGEFAKRKIWQYMVVKGSEKAVNISRKTLRAIVEAGRAVRPDDMSQEAINSRKITGWGDLSGMCFPVKVGIEKAQAGSGYSDKNKILMVITPDMPEYFKVTPPPMETGSYTPSGGYTPAPQANGYPANNQQSNQPSQPSAMPKIMPNWLKQPQAQAQSQAA